jgi:hypothetical protein
LVIERLPALTDTPGRGHAALLPVVGAIAEAHLVALARLDLDHVGAEQRELIGRVGTGENAREVEDLLRRRTACSWLEL